MALKKTDQTYSDIKEQRLADSSLIKMFDIWTDDNNQYFMNIFKTFSIDDSILNNTSNLENFGIVEPWWEDISYTYYNDVDAWWIAALTNDVINPFEEINVGDSISLLKPDFVPLVHRDMENIFKL